MSYEVIARKWRPQAFDEVTGQAHVTTPLRNAIRSERVPHALLLTGPRGVGKTTLARILARCLNCEKGPTDTPCGECAPCTEIAQGTSMDVQEVDAASRTSVDDVRELIQAIRYAPAPGKHRIFVVDEVHMLSAAAFNALLKTLEEPPPRSLFVFATTNPEKIPFTVLSRCQRYDLRRISAAEIVERLALIARTEEVEISDASLLAIAREADGSMRDAQTLLDQVIAFGGAKIADEQVAEVLDLIDRRLLLAILEACVDGDAEAALAACSRAGETGSDPKRLGQALLQTLRDLVVLRIAPQGSLVEGPEEQVAELRALAERCDATRLRRMFRAMLKEQEDLAWAPSPLAVLEMATVRLATMPSGDDVSKLLARIDALERSLAGGGSTGAGPAPGANGAPSGGGSRGGAGGRRPSGRSRSAGPAEAPTAAPPGPGAAPSDPPEPPPRAPESGAPLPVVFDRLRGFAGKRSPGLFAALEGGRLVALGEERLHLVVPTRFSAQRLSGRREALEALCTELFGRTLTVDIECADDVAEAGAPAPADPESLRKLRQDALNDPDVVRAIEELGAEVVEIRPLGEGS